MAATNKMKTVADASGAAKAEMKDEPGAAPDGALAGDIVSFVSTLDGGHRRAGMRFGKAPTKVDLSSLDEDQMAALRDDPHLRAVVIDAGPEA